MRLPGKIALVTGAGSGFGEGMARRFAAEGAARRGRSTSASTRRAASRQAIGAARHCHRGRRVVDRRRSRRPSNEATATFGVPDIVVNNAGITHRNRPVLEVDEATFDRIFAVNVKSIFNMVRAVVPLMRENGGGVILNVGSTAGMRPRPGLTWYNASKGAVNLVSKSLAVELAPWRDPRQRPLPRDGRDRPARRLHGGRGHAGEPGQLRRHHPARADSRSPRTSPPPRCSSSRMRPHSSPASNCRSTAAGPCRSHVARGLRPASRCSIKNTSRQVHVARGLQTPRAVVQSAAAVCFLN